MRISDWSSDVCSSDLLRGRGGGQSIDAFGIGPAGGHELVGSINRLEPGEALVCGMSQPVLLGIPIGSQAHRYGYSRVSESQASRRHGKGDLEESPEIDVINSRDWSDESSQCVKMLGSIPVAEVDRPCRARSRN